MYGCGIAITFTTWFLTTWGPALLMDAGVSGLRDASAMATLFRLAMMAGLPVMGVLGDGLPVARDRACLIATLLTLSGVLFLGLGWRIRYAVQSVYAVQPIAVLALAMAVLAITSAAWPLVAMFLAAEAPYRLGLTYGVANTLWQVGGLGDPLIGGWLRDTTASFPGGCCLAAALLGLTTLAVLLAYPRKP